MSREEMVFSKRAMMVVAVLSVLGAQLLGGFIAGLRTARAQDEVVQKATAAATAAAVAAVQTSVEPLKIEMARHEAMDDERQKATDHRQEETIDRVEVLEKGGR